MNTTLDFIDVGSLHLCVAQAGTGAAMLFLHGLGWDHRLWEQAFDRYSGRFRVIAGDTRGHGQSDQSPTSFTIRDCAEDWLTVLDRLQIDRLHLVGFSQGGMIAMQMALLQPDRFDRLILACTTCCTAPEVAANMQQRMQLMDEIGSLAGAKLSSESIFSPEFIQQHPNIIEAFVSQRAAFNQATLKQAMLALLGFNLCQQLQQLAQPCLVIAGERDRLTPLGAVQQIHHHLPNSQLVVIPSTGHMVPIEQPQRFYECIDVFLEDVE